MTLMKMNDKVCFTCFLEALSQKIEASHFQSFWNQLQQNGVTSQPIFEIINDVAYLTWKNKDRYAEVEFHTNSEIEAITIFPRLGQNREVKDYQFNLSAIPMELIEFLKLFNPL